MTTAQSHTRETVVAVVGPVGDLAGTHLDGFLPLRWVTRAYPTLYDVDEPDLLVLGAATPYLVAAARLLHPRATVIGVISAEAPARLLVDVLHAGADACVRQGALPVLAGHLLAGHRRRTAGRSFY